MKVIDIHSHIYPDDIAVKATESIRAFYGIDGAPMDGTSQLLLERNDLAGVEQMVILPVAIRPDRVQGINDFIQEKAKTCDRFIPFGTVHAGMESVKWPARFEIMSKNPLIIFDGAHNPEGIESATRSIRHYFGNKKLVCVTGLLRDKDFVSEAHTLRSSIDEAYTITPDSPRALSNTEYAEVLRSVGIDAYPCPSPASALAAAIESANDRDTAVICLGSLYTYASIKKALNLFKTGDM